MAVDDAVLDENIAMGFKGGPVFSTDKLVMVNGQERRFQNRSVAIHEYSYGFGNKRRTEVSTLKAFFMDRRGDFKTWLLKDWADFQLVDEVVGVADGVTATFQAIKTYTAGFNPYIRTIQYIKSGTAVGKVGGAATGVSVGATGLITFSPTPVVGSVTLSCEYYVPVRFDGDSFPISVDYPDDLDVLSVADLRAIEVVP